MEKILNREKENDSFIGHLICESRKIYDKLENINRCIDDTLANIKDNTNDVFSTTNGLDKSVISQIADDVCHINEISNELDSYIMKVQESLCTCENCDHCESYKEPSEEAIEYKSRCIALDKELSDDDKAFMDCGRFKCNYKNKE